MTEIFGLRSYDVTADGAMLDLTFEGKFGELLKMSIPADHVDSVINGLTRAKLEATSKREPTRTMLSFRGLQRWMIASLPGHEYVFMILDGSSATEVGYAILPKVAEEMAAALIKQSNITTAQRRDN